MKATPVCGLHVVAMLPTNLLSHSQVRCCFNLSIWHLWPGSLHDYVPKCLLRQDALNITRKCFKKVRSNIELSKPRNLVQAKMQEGKKAQAKVQEQQYIFFGFSADVGLDLRAFWCRLAEMARASIEVSSTRNKMDVWKQYRKWGQEEAEHKKPYRLLPLFATLCQCSIYGAQHHEQRYLQQSGTVMLVSAAHLWHSAVRNAARKTAHPISLPAVVSLTRT